MTAGAHYRISKAKIDKEQSKELDRQRAVDEKHDDKIYTLGLVQFILVIWLIVITIAICK